MADQNDPRYRNAAPHDSEPAQDLDAAREPQAYDPLADLARLINGESLDRDQRPQSDGYDDYSAEPAYGRYDDPQGGADQYGDDRYRESGPQAGYDGSGGHWQDRPYGEQSSAGNAADYDDGWPQPRGMAPHQPAYDPFAAPVHQSPTSSDHRYDSRTYSDRRAPGASFAQDDARSYATRTSEPAYSQPGPQEPEQDPEYASVDAAPASHLASPSEPHAEDAVAEPQDGPVDPFLPAGFDDPSQADSSRVAVATGAAVGAAGAAVVPPFLTPGQQPADDFYDDTPEPPRRKRMALVAAVVGLALLGTAGAFGYRAIFSGPSGPAPVIRASTEPTKIEPPQKQAEEGSAQIAYDRFGHRGQNEKVVSRAETPVDLSSLVNHQPQASQGSLPPNVLSDPRRVRSVPIRGDQAEGEAPSPVMPSITPQSVASSPPFPGVAPRPGEQAQRQAQESQSAASRLASVSSSGAPLDVTPQARPQAQQPTAAPAQRPQSGPLSIVPGGSQQQAQQPPAPARVASAPVSGGFAVQVSSRRTEEEAQNAYRALQTRYSSVLGNQSSFVRRADLGDRGTFYRALVGPFGTRAEAVELCVSLKAAGGDCLVQSN